MNTSVREYDAKLDSKKRITFVPTIIHLSKREQN